MCVCIVWVDLFPFKSASEVVVSPFHGRFGSPDFERYRWFLHNVHPRRHATLSDVGGLVGSFQPCCYELRIVAERLCRAPSSCPIAFATPLISWFGGRSVTMSLLCCGSSTLDWKKMWLRIWVRICSIRRIAWVLCCGEMTA